jgi:2-polyprenyl-3-methyl-5-hydroxy-6-metoxy-1,4-benzoquinol methylase
LGLELCSEYTHRYKKTHKSKEVLEWCLINKLKIDDKGFTKPPLAMPDEFKVEDVVESYRRYYMGEKKRFATWKFSDTPKWFVSES